MTPLLRRPRLASLLVVLVLVAPSCANKVPPNLSPQAVTAWYGTQVIKDLDLLRDGAISASETTPPLLSIETTRQIVTWHKAAITTIHDAPSGWKLTVTTGLKELKASLPPDAQILLQRYFDLAKVALEVLP